MIPITELPAGVTSLLKVRASGVLPRGLEDNVRLVMESFALYALNVRETIDWNVLTNANAGVNNLTVGNPTAFVPPGELWYCWQFQINTNMVAGSALRVRPGVRFDGLFVATGHYESAVALEDLRVSSDYGPFWAKPGTIFCAQVQSITLLPQIAANLTVSKFRV
jgi:hypothetical protein